MRFGTAALPSRDADLAPVRARQDIKEAFDLFDVDETGVISTDDLMVTLRAMGFEPSPTQLQAMVVAVGGDPQATTVTEEQFFKIMTNKMEEVSSHEETCQAFRMFEPSGQSAEEGPMVTAEDVERITEMLGLQDNDSASRIQGMIRDADVSGTGGDRGGNAVYSSFLLKNAMYNVANEAKCAM